jgi:hypothetical protein
LKNGVGIRSGTMKLTLIKNISKSLGTRYVKYGGFAAIVTVAVIVAAIFVNLIFQQFSFQFDLTEEKLFSLSEQTVQVLGAVKSPVTFYGVWQPGTENPQVREVVELYAAKSRLVRFEEIDPDLNPGLLRRFDKDNQGISAGSLVVEGEKGFKVISGMDMYDFYYNQQGSPQVTGIAVEKRITGALLYVSTGETPVIYEISGHGETALDRVSMKDQVERENHSVKELNLIQSPVPEDASALILNNPLSAFTAVEEERLLDYLEGGGRLLVTLDFRSEAAENLNRVFAGYGIRFDRGVAVETDRNYAVGSLYEFVPSTVSHDIVNPLVEGKSPMVLSFALGISTPDMRRRTVGAFPFLTSSAASYLRTDLDNDSPERSPGDLSGPLNLAVAVQDPEYSQDGKQTRIVAIGCSVLEPVRTFMQQLPGNMDLFMNSLTWVENRPENLSVRSRSTFILPMRMSALQMLIFGIAFVVLIPLAFFILALVTWLRRRHL